METHSTMEIVRQLIGGADSLHTVVDVDWAEVCPGCGDDIGVGDVVVFVADHWRHEDCASPSEEALVGLQRRPGELRAMRVLALYQASVRTSEAPDPQVLAAAAPECHLMPDVSGLVSITYPAASLGAVITTAVALAEVLRGQLVHIARAELGWP